MLLPHRQAPHMSPASRGLCTSSVWGACMGLAAALSKLSEHCNRCVQHASSQDLDAVQKCITWYHVCINHIHHRNFH